MKNKDYKLCFVGDNKAYFTTQDLEKQWGDDWDDAPYEHNAGTPYLWREGEKDNLSLRLKTPWQILDIYYEADLETPCSGHNNSPYSVEAINKGGVAWLQSPSYVKEPIRIFAGTTLSQFLAIIKELRGKVYMQLN